MANKIIVVKLLSEPKPYFFGSIAAIFEPQPDGKRFTPKEIGATMSYLQHRGISKENNVEYLNNKCYIYEDFKTSKQTLRGSFTKKLHEKLKKESK